MTQISPQPRAVAVTAVSPTTLAVSTGRVVRQGGARLAVRQTLEGSPGRLRIAAAAAVVACLVFALLGANAFRAWGSALDDARADAAQLVRVQSIQTSLGQADAAASNAYLSGGVERADQRTAYDQARSQASQLVVLAAAQNPGDATELGTVNEALARYTGLIDQARANNRQQLPLGTAYLRQARAVLTTQIVPALERVTARNQQRVADAYGAANSATAMLVAAGVIVLASLLLVQLWLARRTHRVLNAPLAGATVGVLIALIVGAIALNATSKRANDTATHSYAASVDLAQARIAAFDAKSQESLRLINRGNGAANEKQYNADLAAAKDAFARAGAAGADTAGLAGLAAWDRVHANVVAADGRGDWKAARDLAVNLDPADSNPAFAAFDTTSGDELAVQAQAVDAGLSGTRVLLIVLGWLTLGLGLVAAAAGWFGVSQRLEEYR